MSTSKPAAVREVAAELPQPSEGHPWVIVSDPRGLELWANRLAALDVRVRVVSSQRAVSDMSTAVRYWSGPWQPRLPTPVVLVDWALLDGMSADAATIGQLVLDLPSVQASSALVALRDWDRTGLVLLAETLQDAIWLAGMSDADVVDLDRLRVLTDDIRGLVRTRTVDWDDEEEAVLGIVDELADELRVLLMREALSSLAALWEAAEGAWDRADLSDRLYEKLEDALSRTGEESKYAVLMELLAEHAEVTVLTARVATGLEIGSLLGEDAVSCVRAEGTRWRVDLPSGKAARVFVVDDEATPPVLPPTELVLHWDLPDRWSTMVGRVRRAHQAHQEAVQIVLCRPGERMRELEAGGKAHL